jgi:hypothetical protein
LAIVVAASLTEIVNMPGSCAASSNYIGEYWKLLTLDLSHQTTMILIMAIVVPLCQIQVFVKKNKSCHWHTAKI